jgi:hypothetical protein
VLSALGGSQFTARLEAWVAEAAADEALASRRRERWLKVQAGEEATLAGVLVDVAERGRPVVATTRTDRSHRGVLRLVGVDFCLLETDQRAAVFVGFAALAGVRQPPGETAVTGDRPLALGITLAEVLRLLAGERPRVLLVSGTAATRGELRSVGADVVTLRLDGEAGSAYVALHAVDEVVVDDGSVAGVLS